MTKRKRENQGFPAKGRFRNNILDISVPLFYQTCAGTKCFFGCCCCSFSCFVIYFKKSITVNAIPYPIDGSLVVDHK